MEEHLNILHEKIRTFVRKFYINQLIKGGAIFLVVSLITFIILSALEYYSFFTTPVRAVFFWVYFAIFILTISIYVVYPLLKIWGVGKQMSNEKVAEIIGSYFFEIDDKLLNIIQLEDQLKEENYKSYQLLIAAIDNKIDQIKFFHFVKAIPFHKTYRILRLAAIPVLIFLVIFSIKSEVFTDSTKRIIHYQTYYEKPAPYKFVINENDLTIFQGEDYTLQIKVEGEELPKEIFISTNNKQWKCKKNSNTTFSYTFTKPQKNISFQITTEDYSSALYKLTVLLKPLIISFVMQLDYPAYLNKPPDIIDNSGDAVVPEGTQIRWTFFTRNSDTVLFTSDFINKNLKTEKDKVVCSLKAMETFNYHIINKNTFFTSKDTLDHTITVVRDQFPQISVESQKDSLFMDRVYFKGNIRDDYGFHDLNFIYSKYNDKNELILNRKAINIQINKQSTIEDFYYYFDGGLLELNPGDRIEYYFEIRDNDAVNGYKASQSASQQFKIKTIEEIEKELSQTSSEYKDNISDLMKESAKLIKEIEKMNLQLMQNSTPSWQDKKKMEALIEQFHDLQKQLDNLKHQQNQQNSVEEKYKELSVDIMQKQQKLQQRMEDVLSDEMKKMMQQIEQMMDKFDKNNMQEAVEKMKSSAEDLNKELDIQLQMYKQLEYEKKSQDIIDKTRNLSEEQKKVSEELNNNRNDKNDLFQKMSEIENKFKNIQKDIKDLEKLNKELETPNKQTNTNELQQQIQKEMSGSKESLQKNNRGKASENQKKASEDMDKLADQMEMDMLDSEDEKLGEDIEAVRQLLDNLVQLSFRQEDNMLLTNKLYAKSAFIADAIKEQKTLKEHFKMIDDTLSSLARRQPEIKKFVLNEVNKINDYMALSQEKLVDRNFKIAASNEQFALTSINNLSLMLYESMKNMKSQQSECKNCKKNGGKQKSGNGSCSNPGGKGKKPSAKELQQQLNKQMEALKRSMDQGKQDGNSQNSKNGDQKWSEELAKLAAQQEALRKIMQELQNDLKLKNGVGDRNLDQIIKDMEKTEKELVNRIISQETLKRQKNIETRLLESEKADLQREKEDQRESREAHDIKNMNPPKEWNMDKTNKAQNEMLKTIPVDLIYYYKNKLNQYFFNIES